MFSAEGFERSFEEIVREQQPWPTPAERPMRPMRAACRALEDAAP